MLVLADDLLPVRQTIASGRAAERITGRALTALSATLSFRVGTGLFRPLPARFHSRAEGYFAFGLIPARDLPDPSAAPSFTLRAELELELERAGAAPAAVEATVPGAALALEEVEQDLGGRTVRIERIAGAPFDLSLSVDPSPVALAGIVLRDHDPATPAAGVTVTAGSTSAVTDSGGRFFLSALPLLAEVALDLTDGPTTTTQPFHIDYETPINRVSLSLPS
jgi:hypothetical protein